MDTVFLDLNKTRFEEAPDGTLRVETPELCGLEVEAVLSFPLSHAREYISLRDGKGKQIGIIEKLDDLPLDVRIILERQIYRRYFLPRITAILNASERFGSAVWDVVTDRGPRQITTKVIQEAVAEVEPGRFLITDVENNRYEIRNLDEIDEESRARFLGKI